MRGEEAQGVVTPVVRQTEFEQVGLVHEVMNRHEFDGGHAERRQMLDDGWVREPGVRTAQVLRDVRMLHRDAADVGFVNDGVTPRDPRMRVAVPVEGCALVLRLLNWVHWQPPGLPDSASLRFQVPNLGFHECGPYHQE